MTTLFERVFCEAIDLSRYPKTTPKRVKKKDFAGPRPDAPLFMLKGLRGSKGAQGDYRDYQKARAGGQRRVETPGINRDLSNWPYQRSVGTTRRASLPDAIQRLKQMRGALVGQK